MAVVQHPECGTVALAESDEEASVGGTGLGPRGGQHTGVDGRGPAEDLIPLETHPGDRGYNRVMKSPRGFAPAWTLVASVALLIGAFCSDAVGCPRLFVTWWRGLDRGLVMIASATLAVAALPTVRFRSRKLRGGTLTLFSLACLGPYVVAASSTYYLQAVGTLVQIVISASLVAASNHVLRLHPERNLPRLLSAIGGSGLLLSFLLPSHDGRRYECLLWKVISGGLLDDQWASAFFACCLLPYGILGIVNAIPKSEQPGRRRGVSLYSIFLLVVFPLALLREGWVEHSLNAGYEEFQSRIVSVYLRFWLLGTGYTLLLATGIAEWIGATLEPAEES